MYYETTKMETRHFRIKLKESGLGHMKYESNIISILNIIDIILHYTIKHHLAESKKQNNNNELNLVKSSVHNKQMSVYTQSV